MNKIVTLIFFILIIGCSEEVVVVETSTPVPLTIFFVNDQHGQLDNFAKIKYIVDLERQENEVIVACSGDIFSGNPIVDIYPEKGFPIIDIMNRTGFNISVLGNHEFDYGERVLKDRMEQASFQWVCANADMSASVIPQPPPYHSITAGELKVTFLGLVETNGKRNATIPSTHPWRVQNIDFTRPENMVFQYADLKEQEGADLYVALTHIGHNGSGQILGDFQLAERFPYFDLIIGGHTNQLLDARVNDIPVFQAGNNLNYLGKIELSVADKKLVSVDYELIDLNAYPNFDSDLKDVIDQYNASMPELDQSVGVSSLFHDRPQVGCFYTDALRGQMQVDLTIHNSGGIRSSLDQGEITRREVYEIDPFNNGTITYTMTAGDIKAFFRGTGSGFYYSGLQMLQDGNEIIMLDSMGNTLSDTDEITVGLNDYTPAVFDNYFPESGMTHTLTGAETIISYLESNSEEVSYPSCLRFFRFQ